MRSSYDITITFIVYNLMEQFSEFYHKLYNKNNTYKEIPRLELNMSESSNNVGQPSLSAEYKNGARIIVVVLVLLGIILIWVGHLMIATADWEDSEEMRTVYKNNLILTGLGAMISSIALIGGALTMKDVDKFVRLGMVIAAAMIIVQLMSWGMTGFWYRFY